MPEYDYTLTDHERDVIYTITRTLVSAGNIGLVLEKLTPDQSNAIHTLAAKMASIVDPVGPPAWQLPKFTDQDREAIVSSLMDELADESLKDRAHAALETMPLVEVIGYVFPDDNEDLARMLDVMLTEDDGHINGEFLRLHNDDGDDYDTMLDFAKRMGLITDDENAVTDLGREFRDLWS